ncbi:MAG TPA: long-chain fatty acid--CoA ligase [Myxococcales bacterium]|nr:long-chain fatty acid--CoA ligase [Myxococcales bacterium]
MLAKPKEAAAEAKNLLALMDQRVALQPGAVAAKYKSGSTWKEMTWADLAQRVRQAAEGFIRLGVQPGDRVCIFAATRLEWVVADMATLAAGAIVVPIYASNTAQEAAYILENAGATLCVVDSDQPDGRSPGRLTRIREAWAKTPALQKVVLFDGSGGDDARIHAWGEVASGTSTPELIEEREKRTAAVGPTSPATFIYTSGTTGNPKGVVLTHGNWVYEANASRDIGFMENNEIVLLFLPLAHSFAQVIKAAWLSLGFCLAFAESTEKVVDNCGEVHPTVLPAVPRIFEKVYNKVVSDGSAAPGLQGRLFRWAMGAFDEQATARLEGKPGPMSFALAKKIVFPKIKAKLDVRLGGAMRRFISGGAPLSRKLAYFFDELGFEILEGYGLTETSAGSCVNLPGRVRIGTVGPPFPGTEIKIAEDGEILIRGPGVMKEYYKLPEATAEAIDKDHWFHTGDIGEVDPAGYVRITDRKKDIIVTAGGKNVAPQNIENELKAFAIVSQAMVYGDRRKFLSALVTVSEEQAKKIAADKSLTYGDYADLTQKPAIREAVQSAIDAVNANLPSYETIKKFAVLPSDFTQESGELTPTLKVKRKFATQKYKNLLDGFYDEKLME